MCIRTSNKYHSSHLHLPWAVNILPAFLMEMAVGKSLPHPLSLSQPRAPTSMKVLLIGVFFMLFEEHLNS